MNSSSQLVFDALLASADQANRKRQVERETGHLPSTIAEALPFYRGLIESHHTAMLAADGAEAMRLKEEAYRLAKLLNGGERGVLADENSPGCVLEREAAAPAGAVPLWGQRGDFPITLGSMRVRIGMDGPLQKLMGEYYASIFSGVYGLETVSLRYFNVYGPRQDPSSAYSGVLSLFMRAVLDRKTPTIFGDGEQSRDFTFVDDVAELNLKAARAKAVSGNMYNGGNGGRITLNQAWELLQRIEGVSLPAVYAAPRAGDVRDSQADTTLAVRDLGHAPRFRDRKSTRL